MINLDTSNLFKHFLFHSRSPDLSARDQRIATFVTICIGIFSIGIGHLLCWLCLYDRNFKALQPQNHAVITHIAMNQLTRIKEEDEKKASLSIVSSPAAIAPAADADSKLFAEAVLIIRAAGNAEPGDAHCKLFEEVLKKFDNVNVSQNASCPLTLTHHVAMLGKPLAFIEILKKYGADFSIQEFHHGNTPLIWAIANAHNGMALQILTVGGAQEMNIKDTGSYGNTALHLAVGKGHDKVEASGRRLPASNLELTQVLVDLGANVNATNNARNTPLHFAFLQRNPETIDYLLRHGGDLTIRNQAGKTPLDQINHTYEEAHEILCKAVSIFTLDRAKFNANLGRMETYRNFSKK